MINLLHSQAVPFSDRWNLFLGLQVRREGGVT